MATAFLLMVLSVTIWGSMTFSRRAFTQDLVAAGTRKLDLYTTSLQRELERFEFLPEILAQNQEVIHVLQRFDNGGQNEFLNRYLEKFNSIAQSSDAYVMDGKGLTVAASNWNSELPFVGMNFGFRPYFQSAMQGIPGRYFALGSRSNRRGFYFSSPVRHDDAILGVAVVKVGTDRLEDILSRQEETVIVTDGDGIIFLTTRPEWKFQTLRRLSESARARLRESRRYGDEALDALSVTEEKEYGNGARLLVIADGPGQSPDSPRRPTTAGRFLAQSAPLPYADWTVHILADMGPVERSALTAGILTGTGFALFFFAGAYLAQRRVILLERLRHQRESEETLKRARDELEVRVRERTVDLLAVNARLQTEIADRLKAEEVLRTAQEELVQTGKLAVIGQISAGITHELNQPLSAIRSYSENARTLLDRGRLGEVTRNLECIVELTERMAEITRHLKAFARKSSGGTQPVSLGAAVDNALSLLASHAELENFEILRQGPFDTIMVMGDPVLLEQVMINLLNNALDAMERAGQGRIVLGVQELPETVVLTVRDSGPGIPEEHLSRIFDPFFTTKDVGKGLGLGLSISNSIIRKLGGALRAENHRDGGAQFTVILKKAEGGGMNE